MILNISVLFILSFFSGIALLWVPKVQYRSFKLLLGFSGAYLFAMTVIHILPELFSESDDAGLLGIFVLIGFYIQIVINYFSFGIEHGHIHTHDHHHHSNSKVVMLFVSLLIHSFLEGGLLVHPNAQHATHDTLTLLFGLSLHKIPEAIALSAVLIKEVNNRFLITFLLLIFALSSPFGLFLSDLISSNFESLNTFFPYAFAIVSGNLLQISTTIFFEAEEPDHSFKARKFFVIVFGAALAVLANYCI